jgi:DNA-binding response OmpR family regulator
MKILIADIDSEMLNDIRRTLNKYQPDWQLDTVNDGKQCLKAIKNDDRPDVVITGIELPDMPDFKLVEEIREYSDIPVVVLSGNKDIFTLVRAFDAGANDYIVKPFNNRIFVARLKALIRRREWDKLHLSHFRNNQDEI